MRRISFVFVLLIVCSTILSAKDLVEDKTLIRGELKNGFKYTIRKNKKPKDKAVLRLLVKVGSLEEDDDQKGIAHLVEHMAFNGTKHFKGNDLIKFLESIGVAFGSHLNASTSTKQTIYKLEVPLKDDNLEKAMTIFGDWAGDISFTQKELDKERGVVLEEERSRNSVGFRLYLKSKDIIYANSKYKDRTPIGDKEIIKNISLKRVKDFWEDWYRPEFMHFIAVGDFDEKSMEKLIKKTFKNLKNKSDRKRASRKVPAVEDTRILFLKDKELRSSSLSLDFIGPYYKTKTQEDFKRNLIKNIMFRLFNQKAQEQMIKKNPAAKSIRMISRNLGTNQSIYSFGASFVGLKEIEAFKELTNLIYSVDKFGFMEKDFKRTIKQMKKETVESRKKIGDFSSSSYAHMILAYAIDNDILVGEEDAINIKLKLLTEIKVDEVNKAFRDILLYKNRLITYQVANNSEISKRKLKNILKSARDNVKEEKKKSDLPSSIAPKDLKEAKLVRQTHNQKYDYYEFILDNGIKVIYKYNNYDKDVVVLNAYSRGGYSLYETSKLPDAKYASSIMARSGFWEYNILDVQKIYADKSVSISASIGRYSENIRGKARSRDFQYLMEGVYLLSKKYRFDDNILLNTKTIALSRLKKENRSPNAKFSRELVKFLYKNNKRYTKITKEEIETIDKKDILDIYKDRFTDINNFTFFIVGDIKKDKVLKYIKQYFGTLPTSNRLETYNYRGIKPIEGKQEFIRNYNNENISSVGLSYSSEFPYTYREVVNLFALRSVLNTKLREYIREEKSGVYGVSVRLNISREPYSNQTISIGFTCDPKRKDELTKYVKQVISDLQTKEVKQKYIDAFVKQSINSFKENKKKAGFWLGMLNKHYKYGDSIDTIQEYEFLHKKVNPKIIQDMAKKYFSTKNVLYTQLNPKDKKVKNEVK